MNFEFVQVRYPKLLKLARTIIAKIKFVLFYFSHQSRFDRALMKTALTPESIAKMKRELANVREDKKRSGRLLIQHGGEIKAPAFPPRGSLLTEEERNDPLFRG